MSKVRAVIINREDIVSPFMESILDAQGGFRNGRALGLAEVDKETGEGELIAGVWFEGFNGANMNMHVAAKPGCRWMTREFLYMSFAYPFENAGCKRVTGIVAETNLVARKFDEHLGFTLETRLKDAAPGGDLLIYRMFKDECRWLRLTPRGRIKEH